MTDVLSRIDDLKARNTTVADVSDKIRRCRSVANTRRMYSDKRIDLDIQSVCVDDVSEQVVANTRSKCVMRMDDSSNEVCVLSQTDNLKRRSVTVENEWLYRHYITTRKITGGAGQEEKIFTSGLKK